MVFRFGNSHKLDVFFSLLCLWTFTISEADLMQSFIRANMADGDDLRGLASPAEGKIKSF